jgi:hypothetical protein
MDSHNVAQKYTFIIVDDFSEVGISEYITGSLFSLQ